MKTPVEEDEGQMVKTPDDEAPCHGEEPDDPGSYELKPAPKGKSRAQGRSRAPSESTSTDSKEEDLHLRLHNMEIGDFIRLHQMVTSTQESKRRRTDLSGRYLSGQPRDLKERVHLYWTGKDREAYATAPIGAITHIDNAEFTVRCEEGWYCFSRILASCWGWQELGQHIKVRNRPRRSPFW